VQETSWFKSTGPSCLDLAFDLNEKIRVPPFLNKGYVAFQQQKLYRIHFVRP